MLRLRTVEHVVILGAAAIVGACASAAQLPVSAGIGADPTLPAPKTSAIPLVKVATARAHGRPVGVAIDKSGALLVADDVGNTVWRVK
jgi:hypothetical protein